MDGIEKAHHHTNQHPQVIKDDEINLMDYLLVIYKHRKMILWICGIVVFATAIISLLLPKVYSATASVVPPLDILQEQSEQARGLAAMRSPIVSEAISVSSIADMYAGILKSRTVIDAIIDRFDLMKVYKEEKYRTNVRKKLRKNTTIKVSDEGIVTVTVEDRDPQRAAAIANAYIEELDKQNKRLSTGQATSKRIFLENRLKEIEQELSRIEDLLSREARIKEMLYELLTREYELAKIEEAKTMPTIQILDQAVVPEKRSKPRRKRMVFFAGTAGLFVAIFAAFICEHIARADVPFSATAGKVTET